MLELVTAGAKAPIVEGKIAKVGCGMASVLALTKTGNLYVIGDSYLSGTGAAVTSWTLLASSVADFACCYRSAIIRKSDGSLHFVGVNNQLPTSLGGTLSTVTNVSSFFTTPLAGKTVAGLRINFYSLAILCTDGTVVMSGSNTSGGMGTGTAGTAQRTPTLRSDLSGIKDIQFAMSNIDTTYYLTTTGQIFAAGSSSYGETGIVAATVASFRRIATDSFTYSQIRAGITGMIMFRRASDGTGAICSIGRQIFGSLGTGATSTTTYSTPTSVVSFSSTTVDPDIYIGTYHARYTTDKRLLYFTGNGGAYMGYGSVNNNTRYSFSNLGSTTFSWDSYATTDGTAYAAYVLSSGYLYGAGSGEFSLLPGQGTNITSFALLNTTTLS